MGLDTVPTGIATGVSGSLMGTQVVTAVPGNGAVVLAAGIYTMYAMGANTTYQVLDSTGAWQDIHVTARAALIYSDGVNYRFNNTAAAAQNVTTQKIG